MKSFYVGLALLLALSLLAGISGCAQEAPAPATAPATVPATAPAPAAGKVFELKYAWDGPPTHQIYTDVMTPWMDTVNRESKGRIHVTGYPGGVLGKSDAVYDSLLKGVYDVGNMTVAVKAEQFPLTYSLNLPFISQNPVIATSIMNGPLYDKYFAKEFKDIKVMTLAFSSGNQFYTTKKPLSSITELKGMRIRSGGGLDSNFLAAIGAIPVSVTGPDMYEALQKGTVEGSFYNYASSPAFKYAEVCKYVAEANIGGAAWFFGMSKAVWDSLPRDLQLVIEYANKDVAKNFTTTYVQHEASGKKYLTDNGVQIRLLSADELSSLKAASKPIIDKWIQDQEAKGLPARELYAELISQPELYGMPK